MALLRGAIGSDKEYRRDKTYYTIKDNAINQIKQTLTRSLSDPLDILKPNHQLEDLTQAEINLKFQSNKIPAAE